MTDLDERALSTEPATVALSAVDPRDRALAALRAMTRGPKGDRPDYVGTLSTADATVLVGVLDRVLPLYDQHAFGAEELRYLTLYRGLNAEGRTQADKFLGYLVARTTTPDKPRESQPSSANATPLDNSHVGASPLSGDATPVEDSNV